RIPHVERYTAGDVPRLPGPGDEPARAGCAAPFPCDVFPELRFWLADEGNAALGAGAWDAYGRLRAARSVQEAAGVRETPIANAYLLLARRWLSSRFGFEDRPRHLPPGRRCTVVLSHDVDSPFSPLDLRPEARMAVRSARAGRTRDAATQLAGAVARAALFGAVARGRHWLFEDVVREEGRRGVRSTYFFSAASRFLDGGHPLDVRYDVATPRLRAVCRQLTAAGWDVGLHIGFAAAADAGRIAAERRRLEEVTGQPVLGSRHHYRHMTTPFWDSLDAHGRAGLRYDSSVAFDDAPGHRLGIALAFRPWHPGRERAVPVLQVPTIAMDGALFGNRRPWRLRDRRAMRAGETEADAVAHVAALIAELKRFEGVAALDWHEYTSHPSSPLEDWGAAYLQVLDLVAGDQEIDVRTYEELVAAAPEDRILASHD
ncbi:MAG: hypothetical protein QOH46_1567, partial [Solirubrobacteraceae bacterium]|nr:hypothetical protein [Solirubrobacteraceae bacterium]